MTYMLYPSLQGPVLTEAQRPEEVTESRWHQPWSDPSGRLGARQAAAFAIALIASGLSFDPFPITGAGVEPAQLDKFLLPLSEPVRVPTRLAAANNPQHGFVQAAPFEELIEPGKWFAPLSEPVRVPARLIPGANPDLAIDPVALTLAEAVSLDKFLLPLSEPVRIPARLVTGAQQAFTTDPRRLLDPETVTEDRWHQPWSEPQRALGNQKNKLVLRVASQQVEPPNPFGITQPETVRVDKFLLGLSEPVRIKRGLYARHHPAFTIDPTGLITSETIRLDKYLFQLSEPVRVKPGLRPELQQFATVDPVGLTLRRPSARAFAIY